MGLHCVAQAGHELKHSYLSDILELIVDKVHFIQILYSIKILEVQLFPWELSLKNQDEDSGLQDSSPGH